MTRITRPASLRLSGFTLVEMVFTLVISGIILALAAVFITRPIQGYQDLTRRALLVNNAESALRQMAREIRNALPNSVRIDTTIPSGGYALELLPVIDGAMYRDTSGATSDNTGAAQALAFTAGADDQFDIHRLFQRITPPFSSATHRIVINNRGTTNFNAYAPATVIDTTHTSGVITPLSNFVINYSTTTNPPTTVTDETPGIPGSVGATHISFTNLAATPVFHRFSTSPGSASPNQRLYIIQTPVTYLCVPNSTTPSLGTLTRYANYPIQSTQPTTAGVLDGLPDRIRAPVSAQVSACTIKSDFSSVRRYGLVTFELTLSDTTGGTVRLLHQVLVENSR